MPERLTLLALLLTAILGATRALGQEEAAIVLAVALIATGLPHGSGDVLVAWRAGLRGSIVRFASFLLGYVLLAALVWLAWMQWPLFTLAGFLVLSAFHFGATDHDYLGSRPRGPFAPLALLGQGGMPLVLVCVADPTGVRQAFVYLTFGSAAIDDWLVHLGTVLLPLVAIGWVMARLRLGRSRGPRAAALWTAIDVAVFLAATQTGALVAFGVWFAAAHATRHLVTHAPDWQALGRRTLWLVIPGVTLLAVLLVVGIDLATHGAWRRTDSERWIRLVFVGLAALTVPHVLLIEQAHRLRRGAGRGPYRGTSA